MTSKTLEQWLAQLEQGVAGGVIELGLDRIKEVKERMSLNPTCPIITVAGTNGKGSVCAFLTAIYREAGYTAGTLTSPHLIRFNERIAINGQAVDDETIVQSFERIEKARADNLLTYFEFNTLAAVDIFMRHNVDVIILETGLGGRLDAINAWDTSVAMVVSVDLDHQNFLGDTIEKIAYEKAGIFRSGRPAILGEKTPIKSIQQHAQKIGANLIEYGQDFSSQRLDEKQWSFRFNPQNTQHAKARHSLPIPSLRGFYQIDNASCALAAIECLHEQLPVDIGAIRKGLLLAENPARFQVLAGRPIRVLDVGHNPHAAQALKDSLRRLPFAEKRIAIFSILNDKDMASVVSILKSEFDEWRIAPLDLPRGRSIENMLAEFDAIGINRNIIKIFPTIANAWQQTLTEAQENDRIVAFGSFHTIAQIVELMN